MNSIASVGNVTRFSTPGLLFGQPTPFNNLYNSRVTAPGRSDFPGAGSTPNPNQHVIKIDDGNRDQPQIQPVNPNDIAPVLKSTRVTPSRPTPNMDLFPSLIKVETGDSSSFNSPSVLMRSPVYNYNKGDLMVPRSAEAAFSVPYYKIIDDNLDYSELQEDYGSPPSRLPPALEDDYEEGDSSTPYAKEVGHPMSAVTRYKKRRGGRC